jgi:hypothetical protein
MNNGIPKIFCCLFLLIGTEIRAQTVKGIILDIETEEVIPFSNVYFNSSQRGTTSGVDGKFELNTDGFENQDIVISCVGYNTRLIVDFEVGKFYKVYLSSRSNVMREVVVVAKDMPRKKKEEIFLREFLGTSANATRCEIRNLDDVVLTYFKSTKTFEAYCDKPLIIHNKSLGYVIRYFMDDFVKSPDNLFYSGNYIFEEDTSLTFIERKKALKQRGKAYYGSRMHFFREIWGSSTYKLEYYLQDARTEESVDLARLVSVVDKDVKLLRPIGPIKIYYKNEISQIEFVDDQCVPFSKSGFFDSKYLKWQGEMADQRISDLLPFEYWPYR